MSSNTYQPPLSLVIIGTISIGLGAISAGWIALDIVLRKGWRSMMWIMIPVYIINATYLWPITLWTYLKYGRPPKPSPQASHKGHEASGDSSNPSGNEHEGMEHANHDMENGPHEHAGHDMGGKEGGHGHHHDMGAERPMFATITIAVCHCGAGCVLGDIVGEWIVWGTDARIAGELLWTEFIVDFVFAIAFGLIFQYFSIAPMAGQWGPKIL